MQLGSKEMLARLCAGSSLAQELHGKFRNTVLIINTNYEKAARSTSHFLRLVYGRVFDHIVIISEKSIPELNVQGGSRAEGGEEEEKCPWGRRAFPSSTSKVGPQLQGRNRGRSVFEGEEHPQDQPAGWAPGWVPCSRGGGESAGRTPLSGVASCDGEQRRMACHNWMPLGLESCSSV